NSNNKDFRYLHLPEKKIKTIPESIKVIINCSGFQELSSNTSSTLIKNLMKQSLCLINASKRGLEVNQDFEIDKNFFLIGPLLAGNVNSNFRIWHAESCARIFH